MTEVQLKDYQGNNIDPKGSGGGTPASYPANKVTVTSGTGLSSTDTQAALGELKGLIDQIDGGETFKPRGEKQSAATLGDGEYISLTNYPQHNYDGDRLTVGCKIINFVPVTETQEQGQAPAYDGTESQIIIACGHGKAMGAASSEYTSKWFVINSKYVEVWEQVQTTNTPPTPARIAYQAHGLTLIPEVAVDENQNPIVVNGETQTLPRLFQCDIYLNDDYNAEVRIMTDTALNVVPYTVNLTFNITGHPFHQANGLKQVISTRANLKDVTFSAANDKFQYPCWIFGASQEIRWIPILNSMGYKHYLANSMSGRSTVGMYSDCVKALNYGRPKYVLVCCSNDGISLQDTIDRLNDFKALGRQYGFEVLTIVRPNTTKTIIWNEQEENTNNGTNNNQVKRNWVKNNSGLRYVDWGEATSRNSDDNNGTYPSFLSTVDNVHYTTKGATSVALQTLKDFPEIKM